MMPAQDAPLFEALTTPHQSGTPLGLRVIAGVVLFGSAVLTILFWSLGAWPVAGFMGVEVLLVLGLLRAHRRWLGRIGERITLANGRLCVQRTDRKARRQVIEFDAYWTRVSLLPRHGRASELRLAARGRSTEIGSFLPEADKTDLADALARALWNYRNPVFDSPQLEGSARADSVHSGS
ncbi:DUF2244 domain-containing protein [Roseomonas xinghualingensis]|uniref:DUF2244 domain-containing protein n=1 Tax=Roseomonas xinghualingensis TaxID=2986475 RepID=UPI0021F1F4DC|nr:DUF2244 domain-containing protein [Roseomonas sp. SXEYE001]MCV4207898.1 DUF2244 domain-containing protein [Roseomonas sp. SXEYE001]